MSSPNVLFNDNNQAIIVGPVIDGLLYAKTPPQTKYVEDLTITASLYSGRNINDPVTTPGTKVTDFGTSGSLVLPYTSNGIYQAIFSAFAIQPGQYVLVVDAPQSGSGYQLHEEQIVTIQTRQPAQ